MKFRSGSSYKGNFVEDFFEGYGEYVNPKKGTYKGNFKEGKRHGKFEFVPIDGGEVKRYLYEMGSKVKEITDEDE